VIGSKRRLSRWSHFQSTPSWRREISVVSALPNDYFRKRVPMAIAGGEHGGNARFIKLKRHYSLPPNSI
jgi:hypothetical protein